MRKTFTATCRLVVRNGQPSNRVLSDCAPQGVPFETTDPALFDTHMLEVHNRKLGHVWVDHDSRTGGKFAAATPGWVRDAAKPWKYRAVKNSKTFEPKPMEPGADVTWKELVETGAVRVEPKWSDERTGQFVPERRYPVTEWVERTGQVWSLGYWPKSVWVVPYLPFRGELSVLLQDKHGLRVVQTVPAKNYRAEAAA
ncbi:hypothetical protein [Kribbella sp. NPDC051718]|uniref:hypothetical protein n=1 Tax=Kribbella sp. NPDC051718 TaxID=3155168 RepID=UPI00343380F6